MKVTISEGLPNVDYAGSDESKEFETQVNDFITQEIRENLGIEVYPKEGVDLIHTRGKFGYAFALSKFDGKFKKDMGGNRFRYKSNEVEDAIKKLVEKFDFNPKVKYDRGMGVFVYNIFLK